jgi:outer membrane receptor protein involved in Fe transport
LFAQASYDLNEQCALTLGLRYGEESKDASQGAHCTQWDTKNILDPSTCPQLGFVLGEFTPHQFDDLSRDEQDLNYSLNLSYQLNANTLVYATAANGNESGGFNSFALSASRDEAEFGQEEVVSYELGSKMTLAVGAAELNVALFDMDYDDLQASIFTGSTGFKVENAAAASISGLELDGRWLMSDNWMLRGSLGYIDFTFDEYANAGCTAEQRASLNDGTFGFGTFVRPAPGTTGIESAIAVDIDGDGVTDTCEQELSGGTNAYTPEWSGSLSLEYEKDITESLYLRSVVDYNYMGDHHTAQDNDMGLFQDAYSLFNVTLTLGDAEGMWDVSLVARNVFDEEYRISSGDLPLFAGSKQVAWGRPANFALRFRAKFH